MPTLPVEPLGRSLSCACKSYSCRFFSWLRARCSGIAWIAWIAGSHGSRIVRDRAGSRWIALDRAGLLGLAAGGGENVEKSSKTVKKIS